MTILIKEKECTYISDYPAGWKSSSGDPFKFPVWIKANPPFEGEYPCFIKRFEKKDPASIPGWELLVKLEHKFEPSLARVHDIASVEEKGKRIYYVVYEYMEGKTLENLITGNTPVDLTKLTNDLFAAFDTLRKYGYWFPDFVEKNIFSQKGGFVLMDLDSAQPFSRLPHDDMDVSKDYWALVFDYYKKVLGYADLKVTDLSGLSFNYLQVIFLILRLKLSYNPERQQYRHTEVFYELPAELDQLDPAFRDLFTNIYNQRNDPPYAGQADEVRRMIIQKVIPYQPNHRAPASPAIEAFAIYPDIVEKGGSFELSWKVTNASSIELYKNGAFDSRYSPQEKGTTKTVFYDGKARTDYYKLVACAEREQTESKPVEVQVKEKILHSPTPSKPEPEHFSIFEQDSQTTQPSGEDIAEEPAGNQAPHHTEKTSLPDLDSIPKPGPVPDKKPVPPPAPPFFSWNEIIRRYTKGIVIGLAALLALTVLLLIKWWPDGVSEVPVITSVNPRVDRASPVIINGRNFPADPAPIRVLINGLPVVIQSRSDNKLAVEYPKDLDLAHQGRAAQARVIYDTIEVSVRGITLRDSLRVLRHLTFPDAPDNPDGNTGSGEPVLEEPPAPSATAGVFTARERKIMDSIGMIRSLRSIRERSGIRDPKKDLKERVEQKILDSIRSVSAQRAQ